MSHSPAPWRFVNGYAIVDKDDKVIAMVAEGNPDNAYLIATAPDLLLMAKVALLALEMYTPAPGVVDQFTEIVESLRLTIAKAQGQ